MAVFILIIIVLFGTWFAIAGGDESEQTELFSAEVIAHEPLTKAYFDGKTSTKFNIKNIENNHDDIVFEIFDEDGESLYRSNRIAPGYEMNCIELNKELPKGRHECTIEIQYAVEGHVSTVFSIVIEILFKNKKQSKHLVNILFWYCFLLMVRVIDKNIGVIESLNLNKEFHV